MKPRTILIGASVIAAAGALALGAGLAQASTVEEPGEGDTPITGSALEQASAAALAETGAGRVTGTEVGDEESLYEVEVTLDDGTEIDVQLDADFAVVSTKSETPGEN
jgi:uncharacterized membrane protein YkoI